MKLHLPPNHWQVLLCVIRKTYGYHKKVDYIANCQIVEATGLCKAVVSRTLHNLSGMKVIDRKGKYISFQKDWEQWQKLAVSSTLDIELAEQSTNESLQNRQQKLAVSSTKVSSPAVAQKKERKKEIVATPQSVASVSENEKVGQIFSGLKERRGYGSGNAGGEAKAMRWMLRANYSVDDILTCYDCLKEEQFWQNKFLPMMKVQTLIGEYKHPKQKEYCGR